METRNAFNGQINDKIRMNINFITMLLIILWLSRTIPGHIIIMKVRQNCRSPRLDRERPQLIKYYIWHLKNSRAFLKLLWAFAATPRLLKIVYTFRIVAYPKYPSFCCC